MDKLHATLHKASRSVHRDPETRDGFRRTLEALTETPAIAGAPAGFRVPRSLAWALAAIVIASTGASITYASTTAVPGEALYAVKTDLLEPAESALAFSAEAKADVSVMHLERRFQEAATLAAEGKLDEHDDELADSAEADVAAVDRDDQPVARARFEALASVYGPSLNLRDAARSRFAVAVRLGKARDRVSDEVARAATERQLEVARDKQAAAESGAADVAVAARLKTAARLSEAAHEDLARGSYQSALELSGAAAKAAAEAEIFANLVHGSSTTSTTSTTVIPEVRGASTTVTSSIRTSTTRMQGGWQQGSSGSGGSGGSSNGGGGGFFHNLLR